MCSHSLSLSKFNSPLRASLLSIKLWKLYFESPRLKRKFRAFVNQTLSLLSQEGFSDFKWMRAFLRTCCILFFFDVSFLSQMRSLFTQCTTFISLDFSNHRGGRVSLLCVQYSLFCMGITKDPGIQFIVCMQFPFFIIFYLFFFILIFPF